MAIYIFTVLFMLISTVVILSWGKIYTGRMIRTKELELIELYTEAFTLLIKGMESGMHEYRNHLQALGVMHMLLDNYEALNAAQYKYVNELKATPVSQFSPLLCLNNPVLAGFLYYKIIGSKGSFDLRIQREAIHTKASYGDLILLMEILFEQAAISPVETTIIIVASASNLLMVTIQFPAGLTAQGKRSSILQRIKQHIIRTTGAQFTSGPADIAGKNYIQVRLKI